MRGKWKYHDFSYNICEQCSVTVNSLNQQFRSCTFFLDDEIFLVEHVRVRTFFTHATQSMLHYDLFDSFIGEFVYSFLQQFHQLAAAISFELSFLLHLNAKLSALPLSSPSTTINNWNDYYAKVQFLTWFFFTSARLLSQEKYSLMINLMWSISLCRSSTNISHVCDLFRLQVSARHKSFQPHSMRSSFSSNSTNQLKEEEGEKKTRFNCNFITIVGVNDAPICFSISNHIKIRI